MTSIFDDVGLCECCGADFDDFDPSERDDALCCECADAEGAEDVLTKIAEGAVDDARDLLIGLASESSGVVAELIREAQDCARRGDWDDAQHRLRLITEPKFSSLEDCQQQYEAAMAAQRGAA